MGASALVAAQRRGTIGSSDRPWAKKPDAPNCSSCTASGRGLSVRAARSASTFGSVLPRRATLILLLTD